jgi:hypothetical protein
MLQSVHLTMGNLICSKLRKAKHIEIVREKPQLEIIA